MVGLVISDNFLLTGNWQNDNDGTPSINDVTQIQFTEPIIKLLHDEAGLNTVLASALRQAKEINSFAGQDVVVGLPDSFVDHGPRDILLNDLGLSENGIISVVKEIMEKFPVSV